MPKLPLLEPGRRRRNAPRCDSVVLAVYAPFGSDPTLSVYPNAAQAPIAKQTLVKALQKVAAQGVNVSALVDLYDDDSYLVEIAAGKPGEMSIVSAWKQDMSTPQALAGFLRRVHARFPRSELVLSLEGHGGGFLPDIDYTRLTPASMTQWSAGGHSGTVQWTKSSSDTRFQSDGGSPVLPVNSPELPVNSPELPATRLPMSTWGLGAGLAGAIKAGVPRPAVINFANCFNGSVEHLSQVARYADVATGYANYDFFTAGVTYPKVFQRLRQAGSASALQLAQWFAAENEALLHAKQNHPTVGATIVLARMKAVGKAIDTLSLALLAALQADHAGAQALVRQAAVAAQHYDTEPGYELAVPDQFIDVGSFAVQLQAVFPAGSAVVAAAAALQGAVAGVWQYGEWDRPWIDETVVWDFRSRTLGLNILFPDPDLRGLWDWRSPYYLAGTVDPNQPPAQKHVIDFLADRGGASPPWVQFIVEYHKTTPFVGLLPARPPFFPTFNPRFEPKYPHPGDGGPPTSTPPTTPKG